MIVPSSVSIVTSPTLTSSGAWIVTPPASICSGISTGESVSTVTPEPQPTRAAVERTMSKIANFLTRFSFLKGYLSRPPPYTSNHALSCHLPGDKRLSRGCIHDAAPFKQPQGNVEFPPQLYRETNCGGNDQWRLFSSVEERLARLAQLLLAATMRPHNSQSQVEAPSHNRPAYHAPLAGDGASRSHRRDTHAGRQPFVCRGLAARVTLPVWGKEYIVSDGG